MNDNYINDFCNYLETQKRYSKNTVLSYKRDLTLFFLYLKKENINKIDHLAIQSYLSTLYVDNKSTLTISRKLSSFKSYAKFLKTYKQIDCDFLDKVSLPKKAKILPNYLHEEELEKLMNLPINTTLEIRNALIINLLYSSGMRLSELTSLKISDYDQNKNTFKITGKGKKQRIVIFSNKSKYLLDLYLKNRTEHSCIYLLLNKNGKKLTNRGVELILKNISQEYLGHDKLHPHMLRHTFATKLLNNGMDIRTLQELLGHDSLNATQIYTHIAKNEIIELYTNYHPRGDNNSI